MHSDGVNWEDAVSGSVEHNVEKILNSMPPTCVKILDLTVDEKFL